MLRGWSMQTRASRGVVTVDLTRLGLAEVERIRESLVALAPVSTLVLDFRRVTDIQADAVSKLAGVLGALKHVHLEFRGMTLRQARLLDGVRRRSDRDPFACPKFVLDLRRGARGL